MRLSVPTIFLHSHNCTASRVLSTLIPVSKDGSCIQPHTKRRLDAWIHAHDRQQRLCYTPRVERIIVQYTGKLATPSPVSLKMTSGISAPIDCARHLSELLVKQSAIALVNGFPWDMHRPLIKDCELDFVHFKDAHNDPSPANEAFWRSASFLLAATLELSFYPEHAVRLLSNPPLPIESGGFVCDISFTPKSTDAAIWVPCEKELRALSTEGQRIANSGFPFEPLDASLALLESVYADEPLRLREVMQNALSSSSEESINGPIACLYRLGSFVEASAGGPLITSSSLIGRFAVTSFRPLGWLSTHTPDRGTPRVVYRVQGVAIPPAFLTHFTTFDRLMQWAREPNLAVHDKPDYVVGF